jgi:hypothetical protein
VTIGGTGVLNHAGARLVADVADVLGLTEALSTALAPSKQRRRGYDRGEVVVDLAVMTADGGEPISTSPFCATSRRCSARWHRTRRRGAPSKRTTLTRSSGSRLHALGRGRRRGRRARILAST